MFTPNGLSVSSRILMISARTSSNCPDDVSMMPRPPALETAEASCARAIQPMGACMIGYSTPSRSVMRFFIGFILASNLAGADVKLPGQARFAMDFNGLIFRRRKHFLHSSQ